MGWLIFAVWLAGVLSTHLLNAYFNWDDFDGSSSGWMIPVSLIWPVALPVVLFAGLWDFLHQRGKKHREQQEKMRRMRIAQETEMAGLLEQSEGEVDRFVRDLKDQK